MRPPQIVVPVATAADVAETIGFARRHGLRTTPRSGGHCFARRSSAGDIIIDVTPMRSVSLSDGVATVGAGTRLGDLYDALAVHGRTIPAGSAASVGIAGLTLGGGLGILGRMYGLTCDHLLSARVVLADGRIVDCDEHREPELYWALRGAGGGHLGVVTSLVFRTVPAPISTGFRLGWPLDHAAAVVDAWQAWAPTAPDELDANLRLTPSGVTLFGAMHGTAPPLDVFVARVGGGPPRSVDRLTLPYRGVQRYLSGAGDDRTTISKSEYFRRPLPRHAVAALVDNLSTGTHCEVNFTPWGGAYNRVPTDATAFVHREEHFLVEHLASIDERDWLARSWASVRPWGSGRVYPNFPDPELDDWAEAYYGTNHERLLRAKRTYDPDNWFRFPQSLGSGTRDREAAR